MTSRDFVYWLQGYLELHGLSIAPPVLPALTGEQVECVRRHLAMVFTHEIDPSMGPAPNQKILDAIHASGDAVILPPSPFDPTASKIPPHMRPQPGDGPKMRC